MKNIIIPIHSFVDVITNSSTVIYVQVHGKTIELMKELINYFLKQANSDKTADDLFEFKIVNSEKWEDEKIDAIMREEGFVENYGSLPLPWKERKEIAKQIFVKRKEEGEYEGEKDEAYEGYNRQQLILIPKDNSKDVNIVSKFMKIFEIEGCRDG